MLQDIAKRWCFFSVSDTGLLRSALNVVPSFFSFCLNRVHVIYVNLIFVAFFFFLRYKMEKLHNSTQWSLGP